MTLKLDKNNLMNEDTFPVSEHYDMRLYD